MLDVAAARAWRPDDVTAARALVERIARGRAQRPLSDEHWLALTTASADVAAAVTARDDRRVVGFAQAVRGNDACSLELVVDDDHPERSTVAEAVLGATLDALRNDTAATGLVHFWMSAPSPDDDRLARAAGLAPVRRLFQMRRPLPTDRPVEVATRAFRPGQDEAAWLAVNNRAFAGHPEQGGWDHDDLTRRQAESWFDAEGFRLHERDGRLAAFCWTKLHHDQDPVLGEIYVIGVDPDFQGLGLGRQLTLAGLESIASRGVEQGMLYVDESNASAVSMYERLGFTVHHIDVAYGADLGAES